MLFVAAVVLLLVLPDPWNLIGCTVAVVAGCGELFLWKRTVRGRKTAVGSETMIGSEAQVVTPCRPDGQVRLAGELWDARCAAGADPGRLVLVVDRKGLTLIVEPK